MLNKALIYSKQKKYDEAYSVLTDLLHRNDKIDYLKGKGAVYEGLGDIHFHRKEYQEALECRWVAIVIAQKISNKESEIINYNKLGLVYVAMEEYSLAEIIFLETKAEAKTAGYKEQEMQINSHLSNLKADQNNFKAALEYKNEYIKLREVIYSDIRIGKLIDLETAYDKIKREKKVLILKQKIEEAKLMRYLLISGLLLFAVAIVFMIYEYRNKKNANEVLQKLNN